MDGYVTRSQFAVIYGCSKPYVTKLVADRRVVLSADGKLVNVDASMKLLEVTSDPSKAGVRDRWAAYRAGQLPTATNTPRAAVGGLASAAGAGEAGASPANSASAAPPAASSDDPVEPPASGAPAKPLPDESAYHQARTKREQAEAELATMKLKEALGQLLDAQSTLRAFADIQVVARNELLTLADRLTPLVTPEIDTRKVYGTIRAETERICETISTKIAALNQALVNA